jgi:hypothetical protein
MIPVTAPTPDTDETIEKQNEQTGRFLLGLMVTSFVTGMMTSLYGFKNNKTTRKKK